MFSNLALHKKKNMLYYLSAWFSSVRYLGLRLPSFIQKTYKTVCKSRTTPKPGDNDFAKILSLWWTTVSKSDFSRNPPLSVPAEAT